MISRSSQYVGKLSRVNDRNRCCALTFSNILSVCEVLVGKIFCRMRPINALCGFSVIVQMLVSCQSWEI